MNYYRFNLGDYARDTATLTTVQHGAYRLLIDYYYATERALPPDVEECYMIARATDEASRAAVEKVLGRFFESKPDGFHHKRIDEEIALYRDWAESNRVKGRMGGRPPKREKPADQKPEENPAGSQTGSVSETRSEPERNPNPIATKHYVSPNGDTKRAPALSLPAWLPADDWAAFLQHRKKIKAPLTDLAQQRAIAALATLRDEGNAPTAVINRSIVNGWKGLFPLPAETRGKPGGFSRHDARAAAAAAVFGPDDSPTRGETIDG